MIKRHLIALGCLATALAVDDACSEETPSQKKIFKEFIEQSSASSNPRDLALKFKFEIQPNLNLDGNTAQIAIDTLARLGFQCRLAREKQGHLYRSKVFPAFIYCEAYSFDGKKINGAVVTSVMISGWVGDGTSLMDRYGQLVTATVSNVLSTYSPFYIDSRDSSYSVAEGKSLDKSLVIASAGQSVADIVRYAMLHDIGCRPISSKTDDHDVLSCTASHPSPRCRLAMVQVYVSKGKSSLDSFSLWSTDRVAIDKQGPWSCIDSVGGAEEVLSK